MNGQEIQTRILDLIVLINAALRNLRLYPPTSGIILNATARAIQAFDDLFIEIDRVELAESEKSLLILNHPLAEKDQKRPQITSFIEVMLGSGIRSISFEKGLTEEELRGLLEILATPAAELESSGGLHKVMESAALSHVRIDHKVFVALGGDRKTLTDLKLRDEEMVHYLMGTGKGKKIDPASIREAAADPDFVARTIGAGVREINSGKGTVPDKERIRQLSAMLETIQHITMGFDSDALSKSIAGEMGSIESGILTPALQRSAAASGGSESLAGRISRILNPGTRVDPTGRGVSPGSGSESGTGAGGKGAGGAGSVGGGAGGAIGGKKSGGGSMPATLKDAIVEKMVAYLGDRLKAGSGDPVAQVARAFSGIDERLAAQGMLESHLLASRVMVSRKMVDWADAQTDLSESFEQISRQLAEIAQTLMLGRQFAQCSHILQLFSRIFGGKTGRPPAMRALAGDRLKEIATDEVLTLLTRDLFSEDKKRQQTAFKNLTLLDRVVVERMLDLLRDSQVMSERLRLLRVLTEIRPPVDTLIRRLREGGSWYYLRNIILLVGKVGSAAELDDLKVFLEHRHTSVQRETLNTVFNIGGEKRGPLLLAKLNGVEPALQFKILSMLGALGYEPAVEGIADLLDIKARMPAALKEKLAVAACNTLGQIASPGAIPYLQPVIEQKGLFRKRYPQAVRDAAIAALTAINHAQVVGRGKDTPVAGPSAAAPPAAAVRVEKESAMDELKQEEERINTLAAEGRTEEAVKATVDLIRRYATARNFVRAEELRDHLYEVDAMALPQIIAASEIIETAKSEAVDQKDIDLWPELFGALSTEETNALYFALRQERYGSDQTVFNQGDENNRLFFVIRGELKVIHLQDGKEILLKTLQAGDIAGIDTFFSISVCTTSLITLSEAAIHVLERDAMEKWGQEFPGLEAKIEEHCLNREKVSDLLLQKSIERRVHKRVKVEGRVDVQILNSARKPIGKTFRGQAHDISVEGFSFFFKTPKKETARLLLGRNIKITYTFLFRGEEKSLERSGRAIGVSYHLFNDFAIHMKFHHRVEVKTIDAIEAVVSPGGDA